MSNYNMPCSVFDVICMVYLKIIPQVRVGYEMVDSQRSASYPTSASGITVLTWKRPQNIENSLQPYLEKEPIFSLFLILSRRVQLPYLESMA